MKQRDKRTYLIIGLCAVVAIMAVGFAAFSQQLKINSTSEVTSSWCIGFDNTKTDTMTKNAGIVGGTLPTGSITYGGSSCGTKSRTATDLSATFKQPGDSIEYTLTILNEGTLPAAINSIKVGENNVTSNTTIREGNVKFTVNMPSSTSIAAGSSVTMTVVATFQNDEDITHAYSGETQSLSVEINASQDDGNGGFVTTQPAIATPYVYRWSTSYWNANQDISGMTEGTDYVTSASAVTDMNSRGAIFYLKYKIENNIATESYVCYITDTEHCLKGGDGGTAVLDNVSQLSSQQSWFEGQGGSCDLDPNSPYCLGGPFGYVTADSDGNVYVRDPDDFACFVDSDGSSYCDV